MSMSMSMSVGSAGGPALAGFGGTADDLGYRPLTLSFPLGPMALPGFPLQTLPQSKWKFDPKAWEPELWAQLTAQELPSSSWQAITFPNAVLNTNLAVEVQQLQDLMRQDRERYMAEILAQHDHAPLYWMSLLEITQRTKPYTLQLIFDAVKIGETAVLFFKAKYNRPRPSQICPGLFPPFGPPGHPAFPSGHATQGWLISQFLKLVAPEYWDQLKWLAKRVALNRERAGFHYRSDSRGGRHLAAELAKIVTALPATSRFQTTLNLAKAEW
jgi:acid phosphatase (class A)